jgi:FAD:protein FMN transferase
MLQLLGWSVQVGGVSGASEKGGAPLIIDKGVQSTNLGMDTVIMHKVFGEQVEEALRAAEKEVIRLEGMLSRFIPKSEISKVNSSAGIKYEKVSCETYDILSKAIEFSKCCHGCFDVTIGPLTALWKSSRDSLMPPDESRIKGTIPLVNYLDLVFDPGEKAVGLNRNGQSIDLGGIGKGFAADKVLEVLKNYGVLSAFTNFGGNVAAIGSKPDGSPWRVGINHPRQENNLVGVVSVVNKAVVTSGDYQRYFTDRNGKRHHHILDTTTGYPSESGLISSTIVAESSLEADALSTILFLVGMKKGIELLKSFPGTEGIFIDTDQLVYVTKGLQDCFQTNGVIRANILD